MEIWRQSAAFLRCFLFHLKGAGVDNSLQAHASRRIPRRNQWGRQFMRHDSLSESWKTSIISGTPPRWDPET
jgi:hypothetical protein